MKLTNMITKLFGYLKLSSLAFVVLLGVYGIILQKGDLSIWRPENRNQFYYSGGHCSSKSVINGLRLEFRQKLIKSFNKDGELFLPSPENIGLGLYSGSLSQCHLLML